MTHARTRLVAVEIAREAGRLLMEGWGSRPATKMKTGASDVVTEYDQRAEALVVSRLRAAFPGHAIVGEEGTEHTPEGDGSGAPPIWYVDPLDGTMNFAHGLPFFTVSLGLVEGNAPVVGVVHAPVFGWTFSAAVGEGAFRDGEPITVSATRELGQSLLGTGFPYVADNPDANLSEFSAFLKQTHGVRRLGSAALDLAFVSCGWFDGYWERHIKPWDLAGGAALVLAAGGQVSAPDGGPFDARTGAIIASNGLVHEPIRRLLASSAVEPHAPPV